MSYFANKYAPHNSIYPNDPKQRSTVDRLLQYDLNVLYRSLGDFLIPIAGEGKIMATKFMKTIQERKVIEALSYLDSILAANFYVAGNNLTLADFSFYCSLEFADNFKYDLSKYKNINNYYHRLKKYFNSFNNHLDILINENDNSKTSQNCLKAFNNLTNDDKQNLISNKKGKKCGCCPADSICFC